MSTNELAINMVLDILTSSGRVEFSVYDEITKINRVATQRDKMRMFTALTTGNGTFIYRREEGVYEIRTMSPIGNTTYKMEI